MTYKDGIPKGDSIYSNRDWTEWNKECWRFAEGYDCLIDIDLPEHGFLNEGYESASIIKQYLDSKNVPYELRYSGKGFHFVIPHHALPKKTLNPDVEDNIYRWCKKLADFLYYNFSELVDTGIYDSRRLCKIPFSLALYPIDFFVCLPLRGDHEFENFDYRKMRVQNLPNVRGYGSYMFNADGDCSRLKI